MRSCAGNVAQTTANDRCFCALIRPHFTEGSGHHLLPIPLITRTKWVLHICEVAHCTEAYLMYCVPRTIPTERPVIPYMRILLYCFVAVSRSSQIITFLSVTRRGHTCSRWGPTCIQRGASPVVDTAVCIEILFDTLSKLISVSKLITVPLQTIPTLITRRTLHFRARCHHIICLAP